MKAAVIDLGTNTFHLLIAEIKKDGTWEKLLHKRITVKLGQRGIDKNIIAKAPYNRGIKALEIFSATIKEFKIGHVFAFGTAALRTALNGKTFLNDVYNRFGLDIKLISGKEEADLIYLGVRQAVPLGDVKSLIMDIGGGSVEFIIADRSRSYWKASYKIGAALLLDKFKPSDPVTAEERKDIIHFLDSELQSLFSACSIHKPIQLIGSAGSFETFASMIRHRFPLSGSHYGKTAHPISLNHFLSLHDELVASTTASRKKMKGLIKMRVDMIVLAALLLRFVLKKTGVKIMVMSAYSLKEGAVIKAMNKT